MSSLSPAQPIGAGAWRPVDAATGRIADLDGLKALAAAFPESASVQRRLLSAAIRDKDSVVARAALRRLEAMGYALRPQSLDLLAPLLGDQEVAAAKARAEAAGRQVGASARFASIPVQNRLVEGVAFDDRHDRLYLSSIVDRRIVRMDDNRGIAIDGVDGGSFSGLAIDSRRRLLWAASGVVDPTPSPETAFRGLIAVDLDRLAPVRRIAAPKGVSLGDIGIAADGTVYASDPIGGGLYRLRAGAGAIEMLVAPGTLRSPQGIALHPGRRWLYVADYGYGIALIDTKSGAVSRLSAIVPMMLDGTDGLYWFDGGLIAIQNGTSPMRIARISLDRSGRRATGLEVVEANHPDWGEPTTGQVDVANKSLIYVADPQWDRFGPGGALIGEGPLRPNSVRVTPLANDGSPPPAH